MADHVKREKTQQPRLPRGVPAMAVGRPGSNAAGFRLALIPGNASVQDIRALFGAINNLNFALGGLGYEFSLSDGAGDSIEITVEGV